MGVKKQLHGHGDPLLMEVVKGLKDTLHEHQHHEETEESAVRGVGERTFSGKGELMPNRVVLANLRMLIWLVTHHSLNATLGLVPRASYVADALLQETGRYHQAENDHQEALKLASFLRRNKHTSLFDPNSGALFDPIIEVRLGVM